MILLENILQGTAKSEPNLTSSLQPHMYTQKIATIFDPFKSHNGQALDHRRLIRPEKKNQAEFFAFDKFTLQNLANKSE